MLLKKLLESANQRAYAQPRAFATEQVSTFRNCTASYRTRFRKAETVVFSTCFCGTSFKFGFASLSPHAHWCCLTHNMPPSAPTKQRWLRTSVPRVFEDTSTGKWRLRLLYEYVAFLLHLLLNVNFVFFLYYCRSVPFMPEHVLLRTTYEFVRTYIIRRLRSLNAFIS